MNLPASHLPGALLTRLRILTGGLLALPRLAVIVFAAWRNGDGPARDRITAALGSSPALRAGFDFARAFWPNPALSRRLITAYANTGSVIVTRYDDVKDVLRRDGEFTVAYGPRMQAVTGGYNFFLGMQDSPDYIRDVSNNPVIYRYASCDAVIAPNTWRARQVRAGTMVFAANLSAMFDPLRIAHPERFRVDRPWSDYLLWGDGLHTCFGAHLNRVALPAMLKPLLRRPGLRRAAGPAGLIDCQGTPFPVHFWVESDLPQARAAHGTATFPAA